MEKKIKIAQAGFGGRGTGTLSYMLDFFPNVDVVAVCDLYEDRVQNAKNIVESKRPGLNVQAFSDYREMLKLEEVEAVIVTTAWAAHAEIAAAAMRAGKFAAIECGGASSVDECWEIVHAYEQTGKWCMFLENCCYGAEELSLLRMIKDGRFGEMIHVQGGYEHDLRVEITHGVENRHYRYANYVNRCGDLYPQHALGPMQKYLNINRGNRMLTLCSMASKARGLHEFVNMDKGPNSRDAQLEFAEGDIVTTMIKCAHGESMLLTHDTSLPRPYSRGGRVQGTRGIYLEDRRSIYFDNQSPSHEWESFDKYIEADGYEHPLWRRHRLFEAEKSAGHGGMDYLILAAFFDAIENGYEPPIDTYDTATLLAVTPLSEQSCALGGAPVAIPDFTNGKWINRTPAPKSIYALDTIHYDLFR